MSETRPGRNAHSTVVAYLVLFVALSGTAIAASGKIGSNKIKKGAVKTKNLGKQAGKENKLADGAVTTAKLAGQAVTQGKLAPESVGAAKLQTNAVTQKNLARESVGTAQLLSEAVGEGKLKPDAVTRSKVAAGAINGAKVEDGSLGLPKVAQVIADATLPGGDLDAPNCITSDGIAVSDLQSASYVLVIPRIQGWDPSIVLDGYWPVSNTEIKFRVCAVADVTFDDLTVRILGFG